LAKIGLTDRITVAMDNINYGRSAYAIKGKESEGRVIYEKGIADAIAVFKEACTIGDPFILLAVEYTLLILERQFCNKSDKAAITSLNKAIVGFDDAFLALKTVDEPSYTATETTFPHDTNYRYKEYPKDAYHIAFASHKARLQNFLRTPGFDPIEKALLKQRIANIPVAQDGYLEKQKKVFTQEKI